MIFEPHLLPQLSVKRDQGEKCMKINVKPPIKQLREKKINGFDSWGSVDIRFYSL